jgi:hypothetical protein
MTWGWMDLVFIPLGLVLLSFIRVTLVPLKRRRNPAGRPKKEKRDDER